jgi:tryptophanyl-tRNA synthetase
VIENISPISKEISKLKSDKGHILQVLKDGSEKAEAIASEKVKKIKEIIGF